MTILTGEGLDLWRGRVPVIQALDVTLRAGEVVMLIGPNGAGKSTLLAALAGDLPPRRGVLRFAGQRLSAWPAGTLARHRALLRQHSSLTLPFTATEVVRLGCLARALSARETRQISDRAMAMTGVSHLAAGIVPQLSGGEQARVHLARVLAQLWPTDDADGPRLLLLDEPCASLDPRYQHQVCAIAREFAALAGCAVVMTMHDLNLSAQYADRVMLLHRGRLMADGPAAEVLSPARIRDCFGVEGCRWSQDGQPLLATRARHAGVAT